LLATLEGLRDWDRLLAFLGLPFLVLVRALAFLALDLGLAFLALVRAVVAFLAEGRRAGFSGVVSGGDSVAGIAAACAGLRPSPMLLANWDRRSE
jgi:hypothetical protein